MSIILVVTGLLIFGTLRVSELGFVDMLYGFLWGHLVWGSKYIPDEQEEPQIEDC
jgi:hypothetical protein